ncbi:MAG: large repetitive protein [Acidobacteriota bacterium]|jgi:CSLREA domain-containing protein|nr:large repetitive protein [Acidobacteriota bacterium]
MRSRLVPWAVCFFAAVTAQAATITVTGIGDTIAADGKCTLREAITAANTNVAVFDCVSGAAGLDTIAFNFAGATTIAVGAVPLPAIIDPLSIDGAALITIDGGNVATLGLDVIANGSSIRGLTIRRFSSIGIRLRSSSNVVAGNVVDANGIGISVDGTVTTAHDNVIGGTSAADRNIVTNNAGTGIRIEGSAAANALHNVASGNYVGLAANGTTVAGNGGDGIDLVFTGAANVANNRIDGSGGAGIHLESATGTLVQTNHVARTTVLAAGGEGVLLENASNNAIGATRSGGPGGNTISGGRSPSFAVATAVRIASGTNNSVLTNTIQRQNTAIPGPDGIAADYPIDLGPAGATPNDACDADTGANHLQNRPALLAAVPDSGGVAISGFLNSTPSSTFTIEFFGEARSFGAFTAPSQYLGYIIVTTNTLCNAEFRVLLPSISPFPHHDAYSATATNAAGATSELTTVNGAFDFTVTKQFSPTVVAVNAPSHLTFTLPVRLLAGAASFTDVLPNGMTASNVTTTCPGTTASANGSTISVTANMLAITTPCTVEADVVAFARGVYTNSLLIGAVTGSAPDGDPYLYPVTNGTASVATLTVFAPNPIVAKSFAAPMTTIGTPNRMTITLTNPNPGAAITNVVVSDAYPSNLKNAPAPNASTTCGGTLTASGGASSLSLSGGTIAAGSSCTISVDVLSDIAGTYTNSLFFANVNSSAGPNLVIASASMNVVLPAPLIAKSFAEPNIAPGAPDRLTITLTNPNAAVMRGVTFADYYPANLVNATPPNASTTCGGGLEAVAGSNSLALFDGIITASGSCTVTVDLTSSVPGTYTNLVPAGSVTASNALPNASVASATVIVATPMPALSHRMLLLLAALLCSIAALRLRT